MQLVRAPVQSALLGSRLSSAHRAPKLAVRANADDRSKVVREYREDSGEVVVPGEEKKADNALYADQVTAQVRAKDNMSKEMKQKLRQEYYGLGGAENQAMSSNYFLWIIAIVSVLAVLTKLTGAI